MEARIRATRFTAKVEADQSTSIGALFANPAVKVAVVRRKKDGKVKATLYAEY